MIDPFKHNLYYRRLGLLYVIAKIELGSDVDPYDLYFLERYLSKGKSEELTSKQRFALNYMYNKNRYIDEESLYHISPKINLSPQRIKNWFLDRRSKEEN